MRFPQALSGAWTLRRHLSPWDRLELLAPLPFEDLQASLVVT